jgi:hypothetical protein
MSDKKEIFIPPSTAIESFVHVFEDSDCSIAFTEDASILISATLRGTEVKWFADDSTIPILCMDEPRDHATIRSIKMIFHIPYSQ